MENLILIERVLPSKDWATVLFFIGFSIIAVNRTIFGVRFSEFTKLAASNKYLKIYKDNTNLRNSFTLSFLLVQLISITFFIQITLKAFELIPDYSFGSFLMLLNFVTTFIIGKYLIDKIISTTFGIDEFSDALNLQKATYRNYIGMLLLAVNVLLFYNNITNKLIIGFMLIALIATNILLYVLFIKNNQKSIMNKVFYFILYLCTLEIAPYLLLYFWLKDYGAL
ncbi:DUF4271 domain-containing protein [Myroides odoratimimus]|uniref:DUF4271 domain-containing protein n=1 Tax=Myroides odoratimimus CCUG 10230 TaxID=883150 RepID=A0ABN0E7P4_9FLAO|nr:MULTISPECIES: DUF4271 domain-containing protein [Myroides]AJA67993.1 Protein of unknown function DUF4271 [Myroides sp. A21]EHO07074.1 hypothetical protein HMPREF9712_02863 [Myroides odoratimimus CCUG 10230]MCA4791678.1 DUF4271 domain-containing protein [Myroides odoratimimus]MCA4806119.1 DUF4271 domain-containing protein [Myroides odoratimimus]MCA4818939.1 DUF4271 domain-containing protein [Myroides odoratimimus]